MPTPTVSFRVPQAQRTAVRAVVNAIKDAPELAAEAAEFVAHQPGAKAAGAGPFRSETAAISFLVGRLTAALRPEAVFLFGSRATGTARADSDFDLLVVMPDDGNVESPDYFAAHAPVAGCGLGVDVVPCALSDFAAERDEPGTLPFAAAHEGRLLYARPGGPLRGSSTR